ncbi:hypothetical protein FISHEDRAFT_68425 [Fistulina hepatica ATCC 64428]|uniref:Protein kinase domain-containing protein n=1 Tax=Fistulina hepatica ATCC 64428 TaxID=1128425 RepID=A0A0D7APR8_9AGAR|nr:hypothetical protein FISHEDRAFT_68425 [Fistulina hepatica ATCC 64428]
MTDTPVPSDANALTLSGAPLPSPRTPPPASDSAAGDATAIQGPTTPRKPHNSGEKTRTPSRRPGFDGYVSSTIVDRTEARKILVEGVKYQLRGHMEPTSFCQRFLNPKNAVEVDPMMKWDSMSLEEHQEIHALLKILGSVSTPKDQASDSNKTKTKQDENAMYDPAIKLYKKFMPCMQHINTSTHSLDSGGKGERKIDLTTTAWKATIVDGRVPFYLVDLPTELKPRATQDPLNHASGVSDDLFDPTSSAHPQSNTSSTLTGTTASGSGGTSPVDRCTSSVTEVPPRKVSAVTPTTAVGKETWGQMLDYASRVYGSHPRTCLFYVWIGGNCARLFRFDSSGVVATDRFEYAPKSVHEISPLVYFLLSFAAARPVDRGVDPTVHIIDPDGSKNDQEHIAQLRAHPELRIFDPFSGSLKALPGENPESKDFKRKDRAHMCQTQRGGRYIGTKNPIGLRITIYNNGDITKPTDYLAWCPFKLPHSVNGRRTFAYPAIKCDAGAGAEPVLLKISNRDVHVKNVDGEIAILKALNKRGVKYVPKFVAGGDMPEDDGLPSISRSREVANDLQEWRQQRFVITPCVTRWKLHVTWKSVSVLCTMRLKDLSAHEDAYGTDETPQEQRALHRDISLGNLMLTPTGQGCLIDWDLAILLSTVSMCEGVVRQIEITGTWYFMAAYLLQYPGTAVHGFQEDIESFLWAFAFFLLRYFEFEGLSWQELNNIERDVYRGVTGATRAGNLPRGGGAKSTALRITSEWLRNMQHPQIPDVVQWVREVSKRAYYFFRDRCDAMDGEETADFHKLYRKNAQMDDYTATKSSFETAMKALRGTEEGRVQIKLVDRFQLAAAKDSAAGKKRAAEEQSSASLSKKQRSSGTFPSSPDISSHTRRGANGPHNPSRKRNGASSASGSIPHHAPAISSPLAFSSAMGGPTAS